MQLQKIMVATDFSEQAERAMAQAMKIAHHTGAEIILMHATVVPEGHAKVPESMAWATEHWENHLREQLSLRRAELESVRERYSGQGVTVSHVFLDGFAEAGIAQAAKELDVDLIVMGTHGRTGMQRFLLGSIAERAVRIADRPVLISRANGSHSAGYKRILVPTDFSETAEKALDAAITIAAPTATIELFHCWQLPGFATGSWSGAGAIPGALEALREQVVDSCVASGQELLDKYSPKHPNLMFTLAEEAPRHGIQKKLDDNGFDLVAMGSHGREGIRRWLLGSVAEGTVRHAPCSVLVFHDR